MARRFAAGTELSKAICGAVGVDPMIVTELNLHLRAGYVPKMDLSVLVYDEVTKEIDWEQLFRAQGLDVTLTLVDPFTEER